MTYGRVNDVIFYKGVKIYPTAINEVLVKYPEIREYQLVFTKEPAKFEILIETDKPSEELIAADIQAVAFVHADIRFVKGLPRWEGKSKRVAIK
ncbi:hypothetical protein [Stygiolobus azoricus]|uniref:AMP-dependent ligase C-terminal domain-containing protein n=1 Tax=Stygiolobus azoricus TaxID=41675 RepID=A0A650CQ06_9CREN|nr:hypothetical protein [Stygiolobus azoricus]QGR19863.1 hypothetical protein D1868_07640 [Stygiolobus azoricus]